MLHLIRKPVRVHTGDESFLTIIAHSEAPTSSSTGDDELGLTPGLKRDDVRVDVCRKYIFFTKKKEKRKKTHARASIYLSSSKCVSRCYAFLLSRDTSCLVSCVRRIRCVTVGTRVRRVFGGAMNGAFVVVFFSYNH